MTDHVQATAVIETLQLMVKHRGLSPLKPHPATLSDESSTSFFIASGPNACCIVALLGLDQCKSSLAKEVVEEANAAHATQLVLVTSGTTVDVTPSAIKLLMQAQNTPPMKTVNTFCSLDLARPYVEHKLVPAHRRVPPEDVDTFLAQHYTCRAELGRL